MGGSDPYVILKDADLDQAVSACVTGRLLNTGQSCIAAKRFIVDATIHSEFEDKIVVAMKKQVVGDPFEEETTVGPMVNESAKEELESQVKASIKAGARVLYESEIPQTENSAFHPVTVYLMLPQVWPHLMRNCLVLWLL